jgi:beta-glucosidase
MAWAERVPAIVYAWYPGQEGGRALADILVGDAEPSGRLPTTFAVRLEDVPAMINYPGERGAVHYGEGLFIGYRAFDRTAVAPRFPFGHGLSYTTFEWGPASLSPASSGEGVPVVVEVPVTNTGLRRGVEIVQVYVGDPEASVIRPPKELKGFSRLALDPGETGVARVVLDERAFAFWDPATSAWTVEPGEFDVIVAASATDIRTRMTFVRS